MKVFGLIALILLLPFTLWFALIVLTHAGLPQLHSGLGEWFGLGVTAIVSGRVCFRLPLPLLARIAAFVVYVPVIGFALVISASSLTALFFAIAHKGATKTN